MLSLECTFTVSRCLGPQLQQLFLLDDCYKVAENDAIDCEHGDLREGSFVGLRMASCSATRYRRQSGRKAFFADRGRCAALDINSIDFIWNLF